MNLKDVQASANNATAEPNKPMAAKPSLSQLIANGGNTLKEFKSKDVESLINGYASSIKNILPKVMTPERFIGQVCHIVTSNPDIKACTPSSLIGAVLQSATLGFAPVPTLGYCYFVPYNNRKKDGTYAKEVQFQLGYKGTIDLARRSGEIEDVYAEVVYQGDEFSYDLGLKRTLSHRRTDASVEEDNAITHVYGVCHYKDGGFNFVVLTRAQVEKLRMRNPMQKRGLTGAWLTDYAAMAKAKAIKQLAKYMPLTTEIASVFSGDEMVLDKSNFDSDGVLKAEELNYTEYTEVENEQVSEDADEQPKNE